MQFQTYLPTKNDWDPIVGIGLAGNDNWIRAVANSLRLPLKKRAVSPTPLPESDIRRALNGEFIETGRVSVLANRDFPANRARREPRSHTRRTVLFQMKCQLKLVPACPVFVCSNRLRVNFLPPRWSFGLGISGNLRNARQSPMRSSASSAVQCRQGYRRRSTGERRSGMASDSPSFQVRSEAAVGSANGFPVIAFIRPSRVASR